MSAAETIIEGYQREATKLRNELEKSEARERLLRLENQSLKKDNRALEKERNELITLNATLQYESQLSIRANLQPTKN